MAGCPGPRNGRALGAQVIHLPGLLIEAVRHLPQRCERLEGIALLVRGEVVAVLGQDPRQLGVTAHQSGLGGTQLGHYISLLCPSPPITSRSSRTRFALSSN